MHDFTGERRTGAERRTVTLAAYLHGALHPRRRFGRRSTDRYPVIDWHSPRVLAVVFGILSLCVMDGVMTVLLMTHGAAELNPVMAFFLPHNLAGFAATKLLMTSLGVGVLVVSSRMRVFRALPGEALLYAVLIGYAALIAYELEMLAQLPGAFAP